MPTTVSALLFLAKTRPIARQRADGQFELVLRLVDRQGPALVEPWVVSWTGTDAADWWALHANDCLPGAPIQAELVNPRSFRPHPALMCEIHARADRLQLAPRRRSTAPSHEANHG